MGGGTGTGRRSGSNWQFGHRLRASELPTDDVYGLNIELEHAPHMVTGQFGDAHMHFDDYALFGTLCADFMQTVVTIESPDHVKVWVENDELHAYSIPAQAIRAAAGVLSLYVNYRD